MDTAEILFAKLFFIYAKNDDWTLGDVSTLTIIEDRRGRLIVISLYDFTFGASRTFCLTFDHNSCIKTIEFSNDLLS